ncbi:metalloregulator ArsR/SmtB family transcription factor [soil metagenome]
MPSEEQVFIAEESFRMLADQTRIKILWALLQGERTVKDLAQIAGTSPTAVSQHLAKLRLARLVKSRKSGTYVYYTTEDVHVHRLLEQALFHAHHATGHSAPHEQSKSGPDDGRASRRSRLTAQH